MHSNLFVWKRNTGRRNPSERFLSNTGGADVSIRTLGSHLSNRAQPSPPPPENLPGHGGRKLGHHYRCRSRTSRTGFSLEGSVLNSSTTKDTKSHEGVNPLKVSLVVLC